MNSKKIVTISIITLLSLLISAGHILNLNFNRPSHDRSHYIAYAYNTLKYGVYSRGRSLDPSPDMRREPGWPLFLMTSMLLNPSIDLKDSPTKCIARGEDKCIEAITWLKIINIIFLMMCALIASLIVYKILNNVLFSLFCFLMISLSGTLGKYAVSFYNEILTALLILLVSYSLYNLVNNTYSKKRTVIFGLLLGILILTKAIFYYFIFISGICLFVYWKINKISLKRSLYGTAILLFAAFILIGPWKIRNYINFKTFSLAERSGIVLLTRSYFNEAVSKDYIGSIILYSSRIDWIKKKYRKRIDTKLLRELKSSKYKRDAYSLRDKLSSERGLKHPELDNYMFKLGASRILTGIDKHILAVVPVSLKGMFSERGYGFYNKNTSVTVGKKYFNFDVSKYFYSLNAFPNILYMISFVITIFLGLIKKKYSLLFFLLPSIYLFAMYASFSHFLARYSAPLIPIYVICTSIVLFEFNKLFKKFFKSLYEIRI